MDLLKRENETDLQYHKRLVYGKLVDHTLSDIDYSELSKLAYGQEYSSDVARRMFYGSKRTLQMVDDERLQKSANTEYASEIDAKLAELRREQQKFYDQRREYNKILSAEGRQEHLHDSLIKAANSLGDSIGNSFFDDYLDHIPVVESDNEAVLVLSDWHYGMTTSNVYNTYNIDICRRRVADVIHSTIERLQLHECSKLHIIVLGDLFHGAIHTSARVASEELVCEQLMQVSELLARAISILSKYVNSTSVYMTYGNHARTIPNKKDNIHADNMERIVPWWLKQRLKDRDDVEIVEADDYEFIFADVCGHEMCAVHGDLDSVKSSPRLLTALFHKKYGKDVEYILLGDKHHRESFEELGVTSMICGSLCGADDYANDKRLYSTPSQLLLIMNPRIGLDAEYVLRCDNE